jgi:NADH-quinone oxidoreductase subunit G
VSLRDLGNADAVIVAGLDSRFAFSVAGVQVRRAVRRGGTLAVVDARESNLVRAADRWLRAAPGEEALTLVRLLRALRGARAAGGDGRPAGRDGGRRPAESEISDVAQRLGRAATLAVVVGPRVFETAGAEALTPELEAVAAREGTTVLPLWEGANVRGALELGAFAGVLPGPRRARGRGLTLGDVAAGSRPSVLYLVGEAPFTTRPDCDYIVAQDLYLPPFEVDAFLPAASFAEASGTLTNLEGRVQELRAVEEDGGARPARPRADWRIFADLAARLGRPGLDFADAAGVRRAIRAEVPGFPADGDRAPRRMAPLPARHRGDEAGAVPAGAGRFVLVPEPSVFRHRGIDLAAVVEGLGELHLEDGLRMNPDDLAALGVEAGDVVTVSVDGLRAALPAHVDAACPRGAAYATPRHAWGGRGGVAAPPALEPLSRLPRRPVRVSVRAGDHTRAKKKGGQRAARR